MQDLLLLSVQLLALLPKAPGLVTRWAPITDNDPLADGFQGGASDISHVRQLLSAGPLEPLVLPESLRGRNLVIAGDSNDRLAFVTLCNMYEARLEEVEDLWDEGHHKLTFQNFPSDTRLQLCHLSDHNMTAMFFFHFGVMSIDPQPPWHSESLQQERWRFLPHLHNDSLAPGARESENMRKHSVVHSSVDLARTWWPRAVADHAPKRPIVFMAQSSLWDSILAQNFLERHRRNVSVMELRTGDPGRPSDAPNHGAAPWGWLDHATTFLEAVRESGLPLERVCWRTNSNCPPETFVDEMSGLQAKDARAAIAAKQGPWADTCLIDWRQEYHVAKGEERKCTLYKNQHYKEAGYVRLWETAWKVLSGFPA